MNHYKIAVIGECMVELQRQGELIKQTFGGDTLNTALYLARLTHEHNITVSYITALGNDPFSDEMVSSWSNEGIDVKFISRFDNKMPGLYHIETDESGERSFYYWRNDSAAKYLFDNPESDFLIKSILGFDAVYLSGITLAILTDSSRTQLFELLNKFKAHGGKVFFDNNYRPKLWPSTESAQLTYLKMLSFTNTAFITFDDDQELFGDVDLEQCVQRTLSSGVEELVIKRGAEECFIVNNGNHDFVAPKPVNKVIDTTAAGDSFSAGYLAKRLTGGDVINSAVMGHKLAGVVIQYKGAIIPQNITPTLDS